VTVPSGKTPAGVVPSPERRSSSGRVPLRPTRAACPARWHRHSPDELRTATSSVPVVAGEEEVATAWVPAGDRLHGGEVALGRRVEGDVASSGGVDRGPLDLFDGAEGGTTEHHEPGKCGSDGPARPVHTASVADHACSGRR
jgi:hypothetical protein